MEKINWMKYQKTKAQLQLCHGLEKSTVCHRSHFIPSDTLWGAVVSGEFCCCKETPGAGNGIKKRGFFSLRFEGSQSKLHRQGLHRQGSGEAPWLRPLLAEGIVVGGETGSH